MSTLAVRNSNPLNIRATHAGLAPWQGQVGSNEGFVVFSSPVYGFRAAAKLMQTYRLRGWNTARKIVEAWAPPTENNTNAYLTDVCADAAIAPDDQLTLSDRATLCALLRAMAIHESGGWFFSQADLTAGVGLALG